MIKPSVRLKAARRELERSRSAYNAATQRIDHAERELQEARQAVDGTRCWYEHAKAQCSAALREQLDAAEADA